MPDIRNWAWVKDMAIAHAVHWLYNIARIVKQKEGDRAEMHVVIENWIEFSKPKYYTHT